ncbi:MAG: hypothetical protein C4K47_06955 [Candidatus Thorarchaeota archaeon]|nr:MAG: hypothetical protein C4K47_06955 [Candidatus Thorarchaeota archaeon]
MPLTILSGSGHTNEDARQMAGLNTSNVHDRRGEILRNVSKIAIACAVIIALGMPLMSFGAAAKPPKPTPTAWMVLYYMDDEDPNLGEWGLYDLQQELPNAVHTNVKTLVMIDPWKAWPDTGNANARYYDVGYQSITLKADLGEVSMGAPASLSNFIIWAKTTYGSASHYALVLQDHGGGWQGVCWDSVPKSDHLSLKDLHDALDTARSATGIVFDVIGFDACEMAYVEVAYQLKDYAQVMVASQDVGWVYGPGESPTGDPPEGTGGWKNDWVISHLSASYTTDAVGFAAIIVHDYMDFWEHYHPLDTYPGFEDHFLTISAVRLGSAYGMSDLMTGIGDFSLCLKERLPTYEPQIWACQQLAAGFGNMHDIDLYNFVDLIDAGDMDETVQMTAAFSQIRTSIASMVCAEWHEPDHRIAHGLNIYFPDTLSEYQGAMVPSPPSSTTPYSWNDFSMSPGGDNWDNFLRDIVNYVVVMYTLEVRVNNAAWGSTDPSGVNSYEYGTSVTVMAYPNPGCAFDHWLLGATPVTGNPYTVGISSNRVLEAVFVQIYYSLTVKAVYFATGRDLGGVSWVKIDGVEKGVTGGTFSVSAGEHTIEVQNSVIVKGKIYDFLFYMDSGPSSNPGTMVVDSDMTIRAAYYNHP